MLSTPLVILFALTVYTPESVIGYREIFLQNLQDKTIFWNSIFHHYTIMYNCTFALWSQFIYYHWPINRAQSSYINTQPTANSQPNYDAIRHMNQATRGVSPITTFTNAMLFISLLVCYHKSWEIQCRTLVLDSSTGYFL